MDRQGLGRTSRWLVWSAAVAVTAVLLGAVVVRLPPAWDRVRYRQGAADARDDVRQGRFVIRVHGEPEAWEQRCVQLLRNRHAVELDRAAPADAAYAAGYNSVSRPAIDRMWGRDVLAECRADARLVHELIFGKAGEFPPCPVLAFVLLRDDRIAHDKPARARGEADARRDLAAGLLRVEVYGFHGPDDEQVRRQFHARYGVELHPVAGCCPDREITSHAFGYNSISIPVIARKFGRDIFAEFTPPGGRGGPGGGG